VRDQVSHPYKTTGNITSSLANNINIKLFSEMLTLKCRMSSGRPCICHRWNINAFPHINTLRESINNMNSNSGKIPSAKIKSFSFYRFWSQSHRGIQFAHIHLCTRCINTVYVTFTARRELEDMWNEPTLFFIHTRKLERHISHRVV
jgi:hypothetical protein